jgi:homogentisate 1,2-dioxygenase
MLYVKVDIHDPMPSPYRWYIYDDANPVMWVTRSDGTYRSRAAAMNAGQTALARMMLDRGDA